MPVNLGLERLDRVLVSRRKPTVVGIVEEEVNLFGVFAVADEATGTVVEEEVRVVQPPLFAHAVEAVSIRLDMHLDVRLRFGPCKSAVRVFVREVFTHLFRLGLGKGQSVVSTKLDYRLRGVVVSSHRS